MAHRVEREGGGGSNPSPSWRGAAATRHWAAAGGAGRAVSLPPPPRGGGNAPVHPQGGASAAGKAHRVFGGGGGRGVNHSPPCGGQRSKMAAGWWSGVGFGGSLRLPGPWGWESPPLHLGPAALTAQPAGRCCRGPFAPARGEGGAASPWARASLVGQRTLRDQVGPLMGSEQLPCVTPRPPSSPQLSQSSKMGRWALPLSPDPSSVCDDQPGHVSPALAVASRRGRLCARCEWLGIGLRWEPGCGTC